MRLVCAFNCCTCNAGYLHSFQHVFIVYAADKSFVSLQKTELDSLPLKVSMWPFCMMLPRLVLASAKCLERVKFFSLVEALAKYPEFVKFL